MNKLIKDFESIETITELRKRGLSQSDFDTLYEIIKELKTNKKSEFIQTSIKNYLIKFKIDVKTKGIGYIATI